MKGRPWRPADATDDPVEFSTSGRRSGGRGPRRAARAFGTRHGGRSHRPRHGLATP
ncbi:hypothetical protein CSC45_6326 [Pseudomonas aeruginosa]|nr:hypothetical protein CSC45_6326 [Pseudomonas aeruginosa]